MSIRRSSLPSKTSGNLRQHHPLSTKLKRGKRKTVEIESSGESAIPIDEIEAAASAVGADLGSIPRSSLKTVDHANTRDCQIVICKLLGLTHTQTASSISTPQSPNGVSDSTITQRIKVNGEWIEQMVNWAEGIKRQYQRAKLDAASAAPLSASELRKAMDSKLGTSWAIIEAAIDEGNLELALWHIEQVIGKPGQKLKIEGQVNHEHKMIWRPERVLLEEEKDLRGSQKLLTALSDDVFEAEVIEEPTDMKTAELAETLKRS